jgi:hypothetical protein
MKPLRPIFLISVFVLVVGLACSALTGGGTPPTQPPPPTQEPVQVLPTPTQPEPTQPPATEAPATEAPTEEPATEAPTTSEFFTEEFASEDALENWDSFSLGSGEDDDLVIEQQDDHLLFDLGDEDLYVYYMYTANEYEDVSIKLNAENRGRNNNNISLVCRMNSEGTQWYEFSVESGGLWYLYAVEDKYNVIANGGTNALKQGREINEYAMTCEGDEITLFINDEEIRSVRDNTYGFNSGLVGFNISSLNVLPITVAVNWFEISQP